MPSVFAYFAPLALLLPIGASGDLASQWADDPAKLDPREVERISGPTDKLQAASNTQAVLPLDVSYQVRIERRVTVRIAPRSRAPRQNLMADLEQSPQPIRYEEGDNANCISINSIAGVQTGSGDRLVLYLRDRRMISARLEKSCRARDFYSGFYVEPGEDGQICVKRDKLQSRAGAKCELDRMRELIPIYN